MSKPKQHHYVPKTYLRNFCFDNEKKQIYFYDKITKKTGFTNIDNIAQEKDFYSDISQEDRVYYEKFYSSNVEPNLKKLLDYILLLDTFGNNETQLLNTVYRNILSKMLAYQMLRTRNARNLMRAKADLISSRTVKQFLDFPKLKENDLFRETVEKYQNMSEDLFKEIALPITIDDNRLNRFAKIFDSMLCVFYKNKTNEKFFISDCPLVIYRLVTQELGLGSAGLGYKDCIIAYPINPNLAAVFFHKDNLLASAFSKYENRRFPITERKNVLTLNRLQLAQCNRQVYSQSPIIM